MATLNNVRAWAVVYGSTATLVTANGTSTSNAYPMPRSDSYTLQLSVITTGTSIAGATCVWQVTNDSLAWLSLGSATALSTNASTASSVGAASIEFNDKSYAFGRAIITNTGTGDALTSLAF